MKLRYSFISTSLIVSIILSGLINAALYTRSANAQAIPISIKALQLTSSPENPQPDEVITVTVVSYAIDIDSANITWYVNGSVLKKGVGLTSVTTKAPKLGKTLSVDVLAVTPGGQEHTQTLTIKSGGIDFIIESSGYVPPFFLGKISPVYQNSVKIVAIPHLANSSGVEYDPTTLVYKWEKESGTVLQDQSGYGKSSIELVGNIVPRPYTLTVTVTTKDGSGFAKGKMFVSPQTAKLAFYVNDLLYGPLFNLAMEKSVRLGSQKEMSIMAIPYGFDNVLSAINQPTFNWSVNNSSQAGLTSNMIVLRAKENSSGSANINLSMENQKNILQSAAAGFSVIFNSPSSATDATQSVSF